MSTTDLFCYINKAETQSLILALKLYTNINKKKKFTDVFSKIIHVLYLIPVKVKKKLSYNPILHIHSKILHKEKGNNPN